LTDYNSIINCTEAEKHRYMQNYHIDFVVEAQNIINRGSKDKNKYCKCQPYLHKTYKEVGILIDSQDILFDLRLQASNSPSLYDWTDSQLSSFLKVF